MTLFAILLGLLPGFAWLFFYLQEDLHPEPKRLIALTFLLGALSAIVAFFIESAVQAQFFALGLPPLSLLALFVFAFVEEIVKFGAAYLAVHRNPHFDEPVDAMIYMVVAALGFATVENLGTVTSGTGGTLLAATIVETASLRFVGATLLHALASGFLGYFWAQSIRNFNAKRFLVWGILLATVLHTFFNYLIITHENLAYAIAFVIFAGFFVLGDFERLKEKKV